MARKFQQGRFRPRNPQKYRGDPTNIIYRSSWELRLLSYLDKHPDVLWYASEEVVIPYRSPIDGKIHRYFPDFVAHKRNRDGKTETVMIEVKPRKETSPPKVNKTKTGKPTKRFLQEAKTWAINQAKWEAAMAFCEKKGWKFTIMTEKDLGIK